MSQSSGEAGIGGQSFLQVAVGRLGALTAAVGFSESEQAAAVGLLDELLQPWGAELVGVAPRMSSDIGDDHFPIELSLALGGPGVAPEVRVLFEARAAGDSMMERWRAGQDLCTRLEARHGANLQALRAIEDLFIPLSPQARYAIWHSACLRRHTEPKFKVYLNPQAQGEGRAPTVISRPWGGSDSSGPAPRQGRIADRVIATGSSQSIWRGPPRRGSRPTRFTPVPRGPRSKTSWQRPPLTLRACSIRSGESSRLETVLLTASRPAPICPGAQGTGRAPAAECCTSRLRARGRRSGGPRPGSSVSARERPGRLRERHPCVRAAPAGGGCRPARVCFAGDRSRRAAGHDLPCAGGLQRRAAAPSCLPRRASSRASGHVRGNLTWTPY